MEEDIEELIELISKTKGISKEEVEKLIEKRVEELHGLIRKSAAALMIAKELGVEIPKKNKIISKTLKIGDLTHGLRNINIYARVLNIIPSYNDSNELNSLKLIIADETGIIPFILWKEQINLAKGIEIGTLIKIEKAYVKKFGKRLELLLSSDGKISIANDDMANIPPLEDLIPEELKNSKVTLVTEKVLLNKYYVKRIEKEKPIACIRGIDLDDKKRVRIIAWGSLAHLIQNVKEKQVIEVKYLLNKGENTLKEYTLTPYSIIREYNIKANEIPYKIFNASELNSSEIFQGIDIEGFISYFEPTKNDQLLAIIHDFCKAITLLITNRNYISKILELYDKLNMTSSLMKVKVYDVDSIENNKYKWINFKTNPWSLIELQEEELVDINYKRVHSIRNATNNSTVRATLTYIRTDILIYDKERNSFSNLFTLSERPQDYVIIPSMKMVFDDGLSTCIALSNSWELFEKLTSIDKKMVIELMDSKDLLRDLINFATSNMKNHEYVIRGLFVEINNLPCNKLVFPKDISDIDIDSEINLLKSELDNLR